ncbi:MAG: hypothetical protein ACNY01_04640 [Desulfobacteria bacterium]
MAFYRKLLKGLVDVSMNQESLNALKGMSDLSPGDFKVVTRKSITGLWCKPFSKRPRPRRFTGGANK